MLLPEVVCSKLLSSTTKAFAYFIWNGLWETALYQTQDRIKKGYTSNITSLFYIILWNSLYHRILMRIVGSREEKG